MLTLSTPAAGRYYLAVNRAKIGRLGPQPAGDFGAFVLTLDEVRAAGPAAPTQLTYEGDYAMTAGQPARLAAKLVDAGGAPIAGRTIVFTFDDGASPCAGGTCAAVTDYRGIAQLATEPIGLSAGIHEVRVSFTGDAHWLASSGSALVVVVGAGGPPPGPGSGRLTGGGWFTTDGSSDRIHFALHADGTVTPPSGDLGYRDPVAGLDLRLDRYAGMTVTDTTVTLTGTVRRADGAVALFRLVATDAGEPGRGNDALRFELLDGSGYVAEGVLGGGNLQLHR